MDPSVSKTEPVTNGVAVVEDNSSETPTQAQSNGVLSKVGTCLSSLVNSYKINFIVM